MKRIPFDKSIATGLRALQALVKKAVKSHNQLAAQVLAAGKYAETEALMRRGRELEKFGAEAEALRKRWREVRRAGAVKQAEAGPATPLWKYYQPVLRALAALGGEARRNDIEAELLRMMGSELLPADHAKLTNGDEKWQRMIRHTRKHLVAEGWIEDRGGFEWKITAAGRRAAEKDLTQAKAPRK